MVRPYRQRGVGVKDTDVAPINRRVAVDVARDAIQVHGGYGLVRQLTADGKTNHLESIWHDSKVGEICGGVTWVQLWSVARVVLGRDVIRWLHGNRPDARISRKPLLLNGIG